MEMWEIEEKAKAVGMDDVTFKMLKSRLEEEFKDDKIMFDVQLMAAISNFVYKSQLTR